MKEREIKQPYGKDNLYSCSDPYKVAMLLCMGAEITKKIPNDPENIVFIMTHPKKKIGDLVEMIHNGEPLELHQFREKHQEIMKYIREQRLAKRKEQKSAKIESAKAEGSAK